MCFENHCGCEEIFFLIGSEKLQELVIGGGFTEWREINTYKDWQDCIENGNGRVNCWRK